MLDLDRHQLYCKQLRLWTLRCVSLVRALLEFFALLKIGLSVSLACHRYSKCFSSLLGSSFFLNIEQWIGAVFRDAVTEHNSSFQYINEGLYIQLCVSNLSTSRPKTVTWRPHSSFETQILFISTCFLNELRCDTKFSVYVANNIGIQNAFSYKLVYNA